MFLKQEKWKTGETGSTYRRTSMALLLKLKRYQGVCGISIWEQGKKEGASENPP